MNLQPFNQEHLKINFCFKFIEADSVGRKFETKKCEEEVSMGAAGGSGGKGGHGGYGGFSSSDSPPKKKSNLSSTGYNSEEAREILDGSLEKRIVAYARIKHGKGEEVAAELSNGNYREGHKDPFEVLEKVCNPSEAESIDDTVNNNYSPSAFKVALKGTANLINKTRWYYPLVGMLPGKYQEKIAERLGDNPFHYTVSSCVLEGIVAGVATTLLRYNLDKGIGEAIAAGGVVTILGGGLNILVKYVIGEGAECPVGSLLTGVPFYAIAAVKAIAKGVKDSYSSAREQLKEQEAQKRIQLEQQPSRIAVEETQPAAEAEEGERETIEQMHEKNSSLLKAKREK